MKRKIKIDNLIENDRLYLANRDWVSNAMGLNKYENEIVNITIDNPADFEIEIEVDKDNIDILLRVRQEFYIPIEMKITLKKYITHIKLDRPVDHIY